jgi:glycosyltransferase involved in cell wall biosynthesis
MMDFVNKPITHIIMEGIINLDTLNLNIDRLETSKEIILYTGTLSKIFGIMNLVEAFIQIPDKNIELWICGSGDSKQDIENVAKQDSRIKFFGLVDSMTALKFQRQATILVNPRTSDGEYTKYSFPSKTIEYLLCGKSVIINRLPGIPEEYYEFVHIPKDESVKALSECISNVLLLNKSLRNEIALKGKNFIMSRKNSKVQTDRILKMISNY